MDLTFLLFGCIMKDEKMGSRSLKIRKGENL